jgi:exodeoxyribonuclease X
VNASAILLSMSKREAKVIFRCLDIETTGLDAATDAIVEIASTDLTHDGSIVATTETLVQPGTPVPPAASAIHHLIDDDLKCAPAIEDVIQKFAGAGVYVAHNSSFEKSFLDRHIGQAVWICTYKCALRVWPELVSYSSQALRYQLGLINPLGIDRASLVPHRALSDATVTAAILVELLKHASWEQLVQWSGEPVLLTVLGFGKHRGERFDAVPKDYLRWIAEAPNSLREEVRSSARYWLQIQDGDVPVAARAAYKSGSDLRGPLRNR